MKRSSYFDNLRIALTILVIYHHTSIAYGASGGSCYVTHDTVKGTIIWFIIALAVIPLIVAAWLDLMKNLAHMSEYIGGFHWRSLFLSYWETIVC